MGSHGTRNWVDIANAAREVLTGLGLVERGYHDLSDMEGDVERLRTLLDTVDATHGQPEVGSVEHLTNVNADLELDNEGLSRQVARMERYRTRATRLEAGARCLLDALDKHARHADRSCPGCGVPVDHRHGDGCPVSGLRGLVDGQPTDGRDGPSRSIDERWDAAVARLGQPTDEPPEADRDAAIDNAVEAADGEMAEGRANFAEWRHLFLDELAAQGYEVAPLSRSPHRDTLRECIGDGLIASGAVEALHRVDQELPPNVVDVITDHVLDLLSWPAEPAEDLRPHKTCIALIEQAIEDADTDSDVTRGVANALDLLREDLQSMAWQESPSAAQRPDPVEDWRTEDRWRGDS